MSIRFRREEKFLIPETTSRRLKAAERALKRQRDKLPLFSKEIAAVQPTPEERVQQQNSHAVRIFQGLRELSAQHWRLGRRNLRRWPQEWQERFAEKWNSHRCPANGTYFATVARSFARDNRLHWED